MMFKALKKTVLTSMILFFTVITFQCMGNFVFTEKIYRFNSKNPGSGNVYMLIDKVYPFVDLNDFVEKVNFLHDNGISFICSVMPVYDNKDLDAMKRFCQVLRYAQSKGGRIILHSSVIHGEDVSGKAVKVKMDSAEKIYVDYGVYPMALDMPQEFLTRKDYGEILNSNKYIGVVMKYSEAPKDENTVYIGGIKSFPSDVKKLYSHLENQNYSDNAVIRKSGGITAIASENGDMLEKAVKLLMNKNLLSQLKSDTFILGKNIDEERKPFEQSSRLTFENLGLDTIQLKGPFRQSSSVQYAFPKNRVLSEGSKIKLFMRYSQNLDFNRSLLTVYLNGIPVGSKKLYKDRCNGDEVELSVPHDIKKSNYLDINIAFDLEMPGSFCQFRQEEMPWAVVTGDSNIYIPNNKVDFYSFDTYPQPFISDGKFNDTAIVVPDNLSENDIEGISRIFSYMGKNMNYNSGNLSVVKSSNFSKKYYSKNLIVYGTPENNTVVKALNSKLWFKYNNSYSSFQRNEKQYLLEPYASNIASFQFDISPYNRERAILMLTSPKQDVLSRSIGFLYSSKQALKLSGDSILVDNLGNLKTFKFKKEASRSIFDKFTSADTGTKTFIGIKALMLIFIVIAIVLYFFKNRKTPAK